MKLIEPTTADQPPYPRQPRDLLAEEGRFNFWRAAPWRMGRDVAQRSQACTLGDDASWTEFLSGMGALVSNLYIMGRDWKTLFWGL